MFKKCVCVCEKATKPRFQTFHQLAEGLSSFGIEAVKVPTSSCSEAVLLLHWDLKH